MIFHKTHICSLCGLHELCGCVSSNLLFEKMIYHKIYIWNLCGLHELCGCASSNILLQKMIFRKIYICDLCGLHELCGYVSSNTVGLKTICHNHNCNAFLHEQLWYGLLGCFDFGRILYKHYIWIFFCNYCDCYCCKKLRLKCLGKCLGNASELPPRFRLNSRHFWSI